MSSHPQFQQFQPAPPMRSSTSDSTKSSGSGNLSPQSPTSPTEHKFFDAISTTIKRARSRSPRADKSRQTMDMPPHQLSTSSASQVPTLKDPVQRPNQPRHASSSSTSSAPALADRPSVSATGRRTSSDMWRGRHANDWLFGGFSVTETTKKAFQYKKT